MSEMLAELVAIPSASSPDPRFDQSNRAVVERLAAWAEAIGFRTAIHALPGEPEKVNLVATRGAGKGGFVFSGHTDTVPCDPDLWSSDPYVLTEREGRLHGLGAADMKGFFVAALHALASIAPHDQSAPIHLLATADAPIGDDDWRTGLPKLPVDVARLLEVPPRPDDSDVTSRALDLALNEFAGGQQ